MDARRGSHVPSPPPPASGMPRLMNMQWPDLPEYRSLQLCLGLKPGVEKKDSDCHTVAGWVLK